MNAFDNAAARLKEHLPTRKSDGKPITAWADQARALNQMRKELTNALDRIAVLEGTVPLPPPVDPPPDPPEPPPPARYAPRAYNTAPNGADARFCLLPEYGVEDVTIDGVRRKRDRMGVLYDVDGRDLGGRTKTLVPGLKPANEMDGREPCEPYVHEGVTIGGPAGYPAGSFDR